MTPLFVCQDSSFCVLAVDFKNLFMKEALFRQIKEQGKAVIKKVTSQLTDEFLKLLKIAKVSFNTLNGLLMEV